jgi:hypothetical protein
MRAGSGVKHLLLTNANWYVGCLLSGKMQGAANGNILVVSEQAVFRAKAQKADVQDARSGRGGSRELFGRSGRRLNSFEPAIHSESAGRRVMHGVPTVEF